LRYSREVARSPGISEMEAAAEMSAYARADVTPQTYAHDVLVNLGRYLRNPAGFSKLLESPTTPYPTAEVVAVLTYLMVFPAFAVGLAMLLVVTRRDAYSQTQSLLLKVAIGALLMQPFVHIGGSRYWTTLGPLLGLSAAVLYAAARPAAGTSGRITGGAPVGWLTGLQALLAGAVVVIAGAVVVLAL
jgi:predicted membrane protein